MPVVALALGRGAWIHPQVCLTPRQTRAAASPEVCTDRDLCSEPSRSHPQAPLFPRARGSPSRPGVRTRGLAVRCLFNHCAMPEAAGISVKVSSLQPGPEFCLSLTLSKCHSLLEPQFPHL